MIICAPDGRHNQDGSAHVACVPIEQIDSWFSIDGPTPDDGFCVQVRTKGGAQIKMMISPMDFHNKFTEYHKNKENKK